MIDGSMQKFPLTLDKILTHAAKWHSNSEIVTGGKEGVASRISYTQLAVHARCVSSLLDGIGVSIGDRVATLAWNSQAHLEVWYGIFGMGAVCHTLNPRLMIPQLSWMVEQSGARVLIVSADLVDSAIEITSRVSSLSHVLIIDGVAGEGNHGAAQFRLLTPLLEQEFGDFDWGVFSEDAPCGLCFTSGSTGAPKGVTYTHRASFLHTLRLLQSDSLALKSSDSVLPVVPMFHANAWGVPFAVPATGGKLVLPGRYADGARLARLIESEKVTVAVGVPTVWLGLAEHLALTRDRLTTLTRIIVGGAPMPPALKDRLESELGVIVQTTWGMTELSPVGTVAVLGDEARAAELSGRPALGVDLMIADERGMPLAEQRGSEGRLHVRGASVIERYFGQDTPATNCDGWFDTGDLARISDRGDLMITGRAKDLIKSGGEWINPAEIEAIIGELPQIALAAVIGRSDEKWGERPILLVELRAGQEISDDELLQALRGRVAPWWLPDSIIRMHAMPLAATGKIDKIELRKSFRDSSRSDDERLGVGNVELPVQRG